ncbi:hypothetical protein [Providencia alcalifaciens]|uniref:Uncharacterized protein n=1 Tax=Providencia alcalifaciens 205/92 TaxID=1256988 RepID=A0AAV3M3Z8_9GAMM|nr:hypothetical protein [Providencia alcalifaciens]EUD10434.1 hypothetical protein HMPREF1563_2069 [Providencia alcalifaciens 205/92]MTC16282.1 hypothetical protein [Providencia alcalifaciens]MTC29149.1 hypothetical protein [Providencia alcalifaciens]MTC61951.1 hypothetical protein [Providencia alcalifaciens]WGZ54979.1 hypothetical protein PO864_03065 [Providencia alcalifaciens]
MPFSIMSCFRGNHSDRPHISSPIQQQPPKALAKLECTTLDGKTPLIQRVSQSSFSLPTSETKALTLVETELTWLSHINGVTGEQKNNLVD